METLCMVAGIFGMSLMILMFYLLLRAVFKDTLDELNDE